MTSSFYDYLFKLTLPFLILSLILLPFLPTSSPELVITLISAGITGAVAALCAHKRRNLKPKPSNGTMKCGGDQPGSS